MADLRSAAHSPVRSQHSQGSSYKHAVPWAVHERAGDGSSFPDGCDASSYDGS